MGDPLLVMSPEGLHCPSAGLWIDPWRPVPRAVITHAHADHARPGMDSYLCSTSCAPLLRARLGPEARIETLDYGERRALDGVQLSLHPAGHVRGSSQVRLEGAGGTWVAGGDFRTEADRTAEAFAPVPCDVFISESTFGLPLYRWRPQAEVIAGIARWWEGNAAAGRCSVLAAYSLGKAQRLIAGLRDHGCTGRIAVHGAMAVVNAAYAEAGVELGAWEPVADGGTYAGSLVICPPAALGSPWIRRFGDAATAMASGWMQVRGQRRRRHVERGFVLSDHADWPGLLQAIAGSGARRVLVTHGQVPALVRWLQERGLDAAPLATEFGHEEDA